MKLLPWIHAGLKYQVSSSHPSDWHKYKQTKALEFISLKQAD